MIILQGKVGVNTDRPDESLVVHGNVKVTGHVVQPSDVRAKEHIREVDTKEQLRNLQQLRIVRYHYNEDFAQHAGLDDDERSDTGVIAQEVQKVIPDAVKAAGDIVLPNGQRIDNFLVVNKVCALNRVLYIAYQLLGLEEPDTHPKTLILGCESRKEYSWKILVQ